MPDDLAVPQLDEPTLEPAPAGSGPEHGSRRRDRGRPSGLIAWLLVTIAALGMLASTPQSAGPDEPVQAATAWYLSGHGLPPDSITSFDVPLSLVVNPCYAFVAQQNAGCMPRRSMNQGTFTLSTALVVNYPPPYYWVVGFGERLAAVAGDEYADIGGRLASLVLNLGVLLLLSIYMRRREPFWGTFLLLVSTPMAVFLGIVVNPSGWEITCGIVMAAALAEAACLRKHVPSESWPRAATAVLVLASLGLSTARPLGFLWAAGLTVSAIILAPNMNRRMLARLAAAVAPGIALGMLWVLTHPGFFSGTPVSPLSAIQLVRAFGDSLMYFPNRLGPMFGVLGWQDTWMPGLFILVNIVAWSALLTRLPSIRKAAMACGILGVVVVPSAIETAGWAAWPFWWQGRYTMPFALGFVLLLLMRSGRLMPRAVSLVSGISLMSLAVMVWVNAARYGFGLDAEGLPLTLRNPGINYARLGVSAAVGLLLLLVSGLLLVQAARMKTDPYSGQEPDYDPLGSNAG